MTSIADDLDLVEPNLASLTPVYLFLQISGGQVGLPLIIATLLLSKKVARHPTLVNFFCTWVIYSVVFCLLLYSRQRDQSPGNLCQVQSVLIHAAPPMCVVATLALVIQLWLTLREPEAQQPLPSSRSRWPKTLRLQVMLAMPYAVFAIFILMTALLQHRSGVVIGSWNGLYCTLREESVIRWTVPAFCTAMLVIIVCFEVLCIVILAAIALRYFRMQRTISDIFPLADQRRTSPAMALRVLVFSIYTLVTLAAGVLFLSGSTLAWPYMVQAALPLAAFLVFGTQKDIILVWRFWKPYPYGRPTFDRLDKDTSANNSNLRQRRTLSAAFSDTSTIFGIERIPTMSIPNV